MDVKLDQIVPLAVEGQEGLLRTPVEKHLHIEISMFRRTRRVSVMVRCDVTRLGHNFWSSDWTTFYLLVVWLLHRTARVSHSRRTKRATVGKSTYIVFYF